MKQITNLKLILPVLSAVFLNACGGSGQDSGQAIEVDQIFSGLSIDGHLARATVFVDSNNNGTRDAWEAYAFTDNQGYYSYNSLTETDYCASELASEQLYCLRANTTADNVVIRIDGGYDVLTGEPFVGQLSRRLDTRISEHISEVVVSPITSLFTNVAEQDRTNILDAIGLSEEDLNVDYLNTDGMGGVNAELLNTALKVHKVVSIMSDHLTDTYTAIGDEYGTPNDASSFIYRDFASSILQTNQDLDDFINDDNALLEVFKSTEMELREIYDDRELALPQILNATGDGHAFERVISVVNDIPSVINTLIPADDTTLNLDQATGAARTIEAVVIKSLEENGQADSSLDNAIEFLTSIENEALTDALTNALSGENADLTAVVNNDFDGEDFDSRDEIVDASSLPADVMPFTAIGGMSLKISDLDLGTAPNNLKDSEVELYFAGDPEEFEGAFSACVKFIDGANSEGELGDGNTEGEIVSGYWSLLNASSENQASFSLLLTITFLGTTYQAIVKPYGTALVDGIEYNLLRSDSDGDFRQWFSQDGLTSYETIPESKQECEQRLPSRIGI